MFKKYNYICEMVLKVLIQSKVLSNLCQKHKDTYYHKDVFDKFAKRWSSYIATQLILKYDCSFVEKSLQVSVCDEHYFTHL